jgi:hypothetical protein
MSTTSAQPPHQVGAGASPSPASPRPPENQPVRPARERADTTGDRLADTKDLKRLPVRALLAELAAVEEQLRTTPFLLPVERATRMNPEAALLLARRRAVVAQLRARRVAWASPEGRERSAAWPPPPWS